MSLSSDASMTKPGVGYIEIFHSKPSWQHCYVIFKDANGDWSKPKENELVDASHIREGFRVFRSTAKKIEFALTNGTARQWEDNNGQNYIVETPGRYVVEHGIRRVSDANDAECSQSILRPGDMYTQVRFRADLWKDCYCCFSADGKEWTDPPGKKMSVVSKPTEQARMFEITVPATKLAFAFNDGGENWDSKLNKNYRTGLPGKYVVTDGIVSYVSPADMDLKILGEASQVPNGAPGTAKISVKPVPQLSVSTS